jgi:ketosteroid isomerase-like protein
MDRDQVAAWVAAYESVWRAPGTDRLAELFTPDATYQQAPYREPVAGLSAIGRVWEDERAGPDETFQMASELVAVEGDIAVLRVEVQYGDPVVLAYRDLWIIHFAPDGKCRAFEEWPFSPGQSYRADNG